MLHVTETKILRAYARSLVWDGDDLVDWVGGGQRFLPNGESVHSGGGYAYCFDAAVSLPGSPFAVIYVEHGTKALLLRGGEIHREFNRSFYRADNTEYPIALFRSSSGRALMAHCPDSYCELHIEDLETGEVLTRSPSRDAFDIFHSRLAVSDDGKHLMSAGWVWHPMECLRVYSIDEALADPTHLDGRGIGVSAIVDALNATFMPDGRLVVACLGVGANDDLVEGESPAGADEDDDVTENESRDAQSLRIYDLQQRPITRQRSLPEDMCNAVVAVGNDHLLALGSELSLIDIATGLEVQRWPHISCPGRFSAIVGNDAERPIYAADSVRMRYAFAQGDDIVVLSFSEGTPPHARASLPADDDRGASSIERER